MELEGEQLEHVAKNRRCPQAAKGEVAAHTATCLQPVQWGRAFGSAGRGQAPVSASLAWHRPAVCSMVVVSWRRSLEAGTYEEIQICVVEGRSAGFNFSLPQRTWKNLAQMKRSFFPPQRFRNRHQAKPGHCYDVCLPPAPSMVVAQTACAHPGDDHVFSCAPDPNICFCLCKMDSCLARWVVMKLYSSESTKAPSDSEQPGVKMMPITKNNIGRPGETVLCWAELSAL